MSRSLTTPPGLHVVRAELAELSDTPEEMNLVRLREATAADHAATESTVPLMNGTLNVAEYIAVLRRFYRIVSAWDRWADTHASPDLRVLLEGRRRATLLANDMLALGESSPSCDENMFHRMEDTAVAGTPRAVFLGRMYVMEGSTLGGQLIAKHVRERLRLPQGQGTAFFTGYGTETMGHWRAFQAVLAALPDSELDTVVASARNMFALFAEAMLPEIETETDQLAKARVPSSAASGRAAASDT